jgi:tetratricopeptide (TPR) repeat protein
MIRRTSLFCFVAILLAAAPCLAQSSQEPSIPANQAPPHSESEPDVSSSNDTRIDLSPPAGDAKMHPNSDVDDITEMHPYNPHKAEKDIEVGDFYFNLKNYRAAASRYAEALQYKPNDADATYKLGESQEKLGQKEEALASYQSYLKILPYGPKAQDAEEAIQRLTNPEADKKEGKKEKKKKSK